MERNGMSGKSLELHCSFSCFLPPFLGFLGVKKMGRILSCNGQLKLVSLFLSLFLSLSLCLSLSLSLSYSLFVSLFLSLSLILSFSLSLSFSCPEGQSDKSTWEMNLTKQLFYFFLPRWNKNRPFSLFPCLQIGAPTFEFPFCFSQLHLIKKKRNLLLAICESGGGERDLHLGREREKKDNFVPFN